MDKNNTGVWQSDIGTIHQDYGKLWRSINGETVQLYKLPDDAVPLAVVPSLPTVGSPEALRFAADVLSSLETDADHYHLCNDLIDLADRLEREQAEKAKREQLAEIVAEVLAAEPFSSTKAERLPDARRLLDRFDITPKAGA